MHELRFVSNAGRDLSFGFGGAVVSTGRQVNAATEEAKSAAPAANYDAEIRPLVERYCHECHGGEDLIEGEINLAAMKRWDDARQHPATWRKVAEMLGNRLMPPEDAEQPTDGRASAIAEWVGGLSRASRRGESGDPGRVVLRRLSNAEYTYTLRDLTGVESLDPAREFPADGAAGEGFTNTGSALVMSPAGDEISGCRKGGCESRGAVAGRVSLFAPHDARDWTDERLAQIREFYGQFTDAGGGSTVNLQGIVFDTNQGGLLPVEKYLAATLCRARGTHRRAARRSRRPRSSTDSTQSILAFFGRASTSGAVTAARRTSLAVAGGEAGGCRGVGGRHCRVAEVVVEIFERGAHRPRGRAEAVDGAGEPAGDEAGIQVQASGIA